MNNHPRAKRGDVEGWSESATRSNINFLYSVDAPGLTGSGYGVTLTVRDCPASHTDWVKLRRAFVERMRRLGLIRLHWVTEWQRRGVPHLHAALWLPPEVPRSLIVGHWIDLAGDDYGSGFKGQHVLPITDSVGWFQYLSKHAARGVAHYQRSSEGIPEGWKKTGRMWGHIGDWPTRQGIRIGLQGREGDRGYFAFRRLVRTWRLADARASGDAYRIDRARHMLTCHQRGLSEVRGVSEWISQPIALAFMANLAERGYRVTS